MPFRCRRSFACSLPRFLVSYFAVLLYNKMLFAFLQWRFRQPIIWKFIESIVTNALTINFYLFLNQQHANHLYTLYISCSYCATGAILLFRVHLANSIYSKYTRKRFVFRRLFAICSLFALQASSALSAVTRLSYLFPHEFASFFFTISKVFGLLLRLFIFSIYTGLCVDEEPFCLSD